MAIKFTEQEFWQLFSLDWKRETNAIDFSESMSSLKTPLGEGHSYSAELRPGFFLDIEDVQWHEPVALELSTQKHPLEFGFVLSGHSDSQRYEYDAGNTFLCGSGMAPGLLDEVVCTDRQQSIVVHIEPDVFRTFVGLHKDVTPSEMSHLFRPNDQEYFVQSGMMTMQMRLALQEIWQCPFQGLERRMFLEGTLMTLMAMRLQQGKEGAGVPTVGTLQARDRHDRIHQARDILEQRLENPPSLLELAERVGLSYYQLKQGFQQWVGCTPFQYLHRYRMAQARLLLYEGKMKVAEVANMVGYCHLGRFSAAFKQRFGILPSDCLKGKLAQ